ncbi:uncharacterized protein [Asterias amurensis]|uniref:uncharacterized protein n=1 Tax=Asterias amurensis TaxID=7602 RepID=UPI003AB5CD19
MATNAPRSCEDDIEIMIRTGVQDPRRKTSKRYKWPHEAILIVQSDRTERIFHSRRKTKKSPSQHAECAFLDDLECADWSLSFEDIFSRMCMPQKMTEYDLFINYSPCVDCADRIIRFINNHPSVAFHIHYAMTYKGGDGLRMLINRDRIALATMTGNTWKAVITSILKFHRKKSKTLLRCKSGYESLAIAVAYLGIETSPGWIRMREKSDETEEEVLEQIYEDNEKFIMMLKMFKAICGRT